MVNTKVISTVLYLIKNKLDVTYSLDIGISINQIPILISDLINQGYCTRRNQELVLTQMGEETLALTPPSTKITRKAVEPKYDQKILAMLPDEIYIPSNIPA